MSDEKRKRGGKGQQPPANPPSTEPTDDEAEPSIGNRKGRRSDAEARKLKALPLLLSGLGAVEVAEAVGVTSWTIHEWMRSDPDFKRALADHARETDAVIADARRELGAYLGAAVKALGTAVLAGDHRAAAKLIALAGAAAPKLLEHELGDGAGELLAKVGAILAKRNAREAGGDESPRDEGEGDETEGSKG